MAELNFSKAFELQVEKSERLTKSNNVSMFSTDIDQSSHFTVQLSGIVLPNGSYYKIDDKAWGSYLPVKSINFSYTSYNNLSVPVAIFGDLQVLQRKQVASITLTCYDHDDTIEKALKAWENRCFPYNAFVAYLADVTETLTYQGFNVKGKMTSSTDYSVIPAGSTSIFRSYSENSEKLISFSLVVVGIYGENAGTTDYGALGYNQMYIS